MARNLDHQESLRIAAEKIRKKREKEEREDKEFYERITSGAQWTFFKLVVAFCTLMVIVTTIEVLFDGPTKKLSENAWKIDRNWEYTWHKVLDIEGYMFVPTLADWGNREEGTLKMTYSPIFRAGKKISYVIKPNEYFKKNHEELRQRSIFTWFPFLQILLLIPLATYIFRRQSAWFNFARITSLLIVFPGTVLVIFFAIL